MTVSPLITLGIDPGTTAIGYAVIESAGARPRLKTAGIFPARADAHSARLIELHRALSEILTRWSPAAVGVERIFFARNAKTAMAVAETRGAILLTTALAGITLYEYTPLEIKKMVTGDGRADKAQIKKMIALTVDSAPERGARDDIFDAIAAAYCCAIGHRSAIQRKEIL